MGEETLRPYRPIRVIFWGCRTTSILGLSDEALHEPTGTEIQNQKDLAIKILIGTSIAVAQMRAHAA